MADSDKAKLEEFMEALGQRVKGPGTIYLTGGASALLFGWRAKTIDVDIKADPEPRGLFEAIAERPLRPVEKRRPQRLRTIPFPHPRTRFLRARADAQDPSSLTKPPCSPLWLILLIHSKCPVF